MEIENFQFQSGKIETHNNKNALGKNKATVVPPYGLFSR